MNMVNLIQFNLEEFSLSKNLIQITKCQMRIRTCRNPLLSPWHLTPVCIVLEAMLWGRGRMDKEKICRDIYS